MEGSFAKETYNLKEPANRSYPISSHSSPYALTEEIRLFLKKKKGGQTFLDGYCSTVQGVLDWFEVDSFAKEPYKTDYILQKRPIIWRSLLIVATPYHLIHCHNRSWRRSDSTYVDPQIGQFPCHVRSFFCPLFCPLFFLSPSLKRADRKKSGHGKKSGHVRSFERRGLLLTPVNTCLKILGLPWKLVWKVRGIPWKFVAYDLYVTCIM